MADAFSVVELSPLALELPPFHPEWQLYYAGLALTPFDGRPRPLVDAVLERTGKQEWWDLIEYALRPLAPAVPTAPGWTPSCPSGTWLYLGPLRLLLDALARQQPVLCCHLARPLSALEQRLLAAIMVLEYPYSWEAEALAVQQLCDLARLRPEPADDPPLERAARLPMARRQRDLLCALQTAQLLGVPYTRVEHRVLAAIGPRLARADRGYAHLLLDGARAGYYSVRDLEKLVQSRLRALDAAAAGPARQA